MTDLKDVQAEPSIQEATIILNLEYGKVTNRRRVPSDTEAIDTEIDRSMLHLGVDLFDAPELRKCITFQAALKARIKHYCVPSFLRGGMFMVKLEAFEIVDKMLDEAKVKFQPLVEAFADVVDKRRDESRARLKSAFDITAYPTREQVLATFSINWRWFTLATPLALKRISMQIYQREVEKAESQLKVATEGITALLAAEAKGLGDHLVERLGYADDGKPKQLRQTAIDNISDFLATFSLRNIGTSDELNDQVARIQNLVRGLDAKTLRGNDQLREDVKTSFKEISAALDRLIVDKPTRFMAKDGE